MLLPWCLFCHGCRPRAMRVERKTLKLREMVTPAFVSADWLAELSGLYSVRSVFISSKDIYSCPPLDGVWRGGGTHPSTRSPLPPSIYTTRTFWSKNA
ncbi:hypothetical protein CEXT_776831 [Caerostris extrusa]|uniref:Secreted protein n=1 Tax=Caerostris extrusa TaxID=172846 RepID=A0AAV4WHB7_CAEEX|nr:hypothetical protein CEXT_776831 [Caerostris extrusa]